MVGLGRRCGYIAQFYGFGAASCRGKWRFRRQYLPFRHKLLCFVLLYKYNFLLLYVPRMRAYVDLGAENTQKLIFISKL